MVTSADSRPVRDSWFDTIHVQTLPVCGASFVDDDSRATATAAHGFQISLQRALVNQLREILTIRVDFPETSGYAPFPHIRGGVTCLAEPIKPVFSARRHARAGGSTLRMRCKDRPARPGILLTMAAPPRPAVDVAFELIPVAAGTAENVIIGSLGTE